MILVSTCDVGAVMHCPDGTDSLESSETKNASPKPAECLFEN